MHNYYDILLQLIGVAFSPTHIEGSKILHLSTSQLLAMVQGVLPDSPTDQHDVFCAATELGFEKKLIEVRDDLGQIVGYQYLWQLWKKQ